MMTKDEFFKQNFLDGLNFYLIAVGCGFVP